MRAGDVCEMLELLAKFVVFTLAAVATVFLALTITTVLVVAFMAVVIVGALHHLATA